MKLIRYIGLIIFFAAFGLFNLLGFLEDYRLEKADIERVIPEGRAELFQEYSSRMIGKDISAQPSFITGLDHAIDGLNTEVLEKYSLTRGDRDQMAELFRDTVQLSRLAEIFDENDPVQQYKLETFSSYGSWLEGRVPSNEEEVKNWIDLVNRNIREYGIINSLGIDRYQRKNIKYQLTKSSSRGPVSRSPFIFLVLTIGGMAVGALMFLLPPLWNSQPGIKNNGKFRQAVTNGGWLGMLIGAWLISFYVVLYYFHEYLTPWIIMVDPVSLWIKGSEAGQFFLYGFLYTLVILVMGIRMIIRYRHSRYQITRTISVMFFQTAFAFLIPEILLRLNQPYFDFKNIWPLDYDLFFDTEINTLVQGGGLGIFMLFWGVGLVLVAVPVFVYFFGKRWYCSWVCGCGGLAETAGDPYRHLSNNSLRSWQVERYMIHGVLVFAVLMTAGVLYTYFSGASTVLGINTYALIETYGAWIGAGFAGVVGTGFYPFMGNRVWCRFGCPLAAYLGLVQRFKSRFRITTNGGQCISCGNCSAYCEMGIDVRWYAQRGQNIVRSSCVGCGICSEVCPRGVLRLENGSEKGRFGEAVLTGSIKA